MWFAVTILISLICGFTLLKFKIPAGAIVGSMLGVACFSILTGEGTLPSLLPSLVLCKIGSYIGCGVTRDDIRSLKQLFIPIIILLLVIQSISVLCGLLIFNYSDLDMRTALFAFAPAGIVDISIVAASLGGDVPVIAVFQSLRIVIIVIVFPYLFGWIAHKSPASRIMISVDTLEKNKKVLQGTANKANTKNFIVTIGLGVFCGLLADYANIPAGALVFSMISVVAFNLTTGNAYIPQFANRIALCLGGAVIGVRFRIDSMVLISELWHLIIVLILGLIIISAILGCILHKVFKWDLPTAFFSSAPGGIADIAVISEDFGANKTRVAFMQLSRFVGMICIYPYIILFLTR